VRIDTKGLSGKNPGSSAVNFDAYRNSYRPRVIWSKPGMAARR